MKSSCSLELWNLGKIIFTFNADFRTTISPAHWIHGSPSTWIGNSLFIRILICPPWVSDKRRYIFVFQFVTNWWITTCAILIADRNPDWIWPKWRTPVTPTTSSIPSQWLGIENWSSRSNPQGLAPDPQLEVEVFEIQERITFSETI